MFPFRLNYNVSILYESMKSYETVQSGEGMKKGLHLLGESIPEII